MTAGKHEDEIEFEDLFGEPPLLKGEDKARYMRLYAALVAEAKPKTLFERMNVCDQTNKLWEEQRLRRLSVALTQGADLAALTTFLETICTDIFEKPAQLALDYFSSDVKAKKAVVARLARYGITAEMIEAKAMQISAGGLLMFDRMTVNRENGRRLLRKELERRPEFAENAVALPSAVSKPVLTN